MRHADPRPWRSSAGATRQPAVIATALLLASAVLVGVQIRACGTDDAPSEPRLAQEPTTAPVESEPIDDPGSDYLQLARYVLRRSDVEGETRLNMSEAESRGWAEEARDAVSSVETDDAELMGVARAFRGVLVMFEEARAEFPSQSDAVEGGLGLLLGLSSEDEDTRGEAFLGALGATMRMDALVKRLHDVYAEHEAARVRLLFRAPVYSGPADGSAHFLGSFTERKNGLDGPDCLVLTNGGGALRDCTIAIRLSNTRGESRTHGYFVPHWPSETEMRFKFESGGNGVYRRTVSSVSTVEYAVFSPRASADKVTLQRPSGGWPTSPRGTGL